MIWMQHDFSFHVSISFYTILFLTTELKVQRRNYVSSVFLSTLLQNRKISNVVKQKFKIEDQLVYFFIVYLDNVLIPKLSSEDVIVILLHQYTFPKCIELTFELFIWYFDINNLSLSLSLSLSQQLYDISFLQIQINMMRWWCTEYAVSKNEINKLTN